MHVGADRPIAVPDRRSHQTPAELNTIIVTCTQDGMAWGTTAVRIELDRADADRGCASGMWFDSGLGEAGSRKLPVSDRVNGVEAEKPPASRLARGFPRANRGEEGRGVPTTREALRAGGGDARRRFSHGGGRRRLSSTTATGRVSGMSDLEAVELDDDEQDNGPEDVIVDLLTGEPRRRTDVEELFQRTILILAKEYRFPLESIGRDVAVVSETSGRRRRRKADLVVYRAGQPHEPANAERIVVLRKPGTKPSDGRNGVAVLHELLDNLPNTELGLWSNGRDVFYYRKVAGPVENSFEELTDFPGAGESLHDMDRPDRRIARVAVTEDLRETIMRCHDYLYGNKSMGAERAFAEMVKLIFAKVHDERELRSSSGHRRQFWVGLTERNSVEGQRAVSQRISNLFQQVKRARDFRDVFRPTDELELDVRSLAWVAGELARYNILDAEVDVKGMAYEAIVATTMKRQRGQFFTPRNVVEAMVQILDPQPGERVLDPACGSARFLVVCLDRFRYRRAAGILGEGATEWDMRRVANSQEVLQEAAAYARRQLFAIDVDPELVRAAKMNMIINNDGHGNVFEANSLTATRTELAAPSGIGHGQLAFESFDVVMTNPPFGAKIPIDDPSVLHGFDLGRRRVYAEPGRYVQTDEVLASRPPEILFIERCMHFLKPGGRLGIVLPDGILGNPDTESIRAWILERAQVLASIDLPVETFLPQVGVQASLLFLRKKTAAEVALGSEDDYPIFMAIAELVGHDRRGQTVFRRDADGFDVYEDVVERFEVLRNGSPTVEQRVLRRPVVADDLPAIAQAYTAWFGYGKNPEM